MLTNLANLCKFAKNKDSKIMETLTIRPRTKKQLAVLKALFEEMKIPFEKAKGHAFESPYNEEFEAKMKRAEEDKKAGRFKAIRTEDLWK